MFQKTNVSGDSKDIYDSNYSYDSNDSDDSDDSNDSYDKNYSMYSSYGGYAINTTSTKKRHDYVLTCCIPALTAH